MPARLLDTRLALNAGATRLIIEANRPIEAELSTLPDRLGLALTLPGAAEPPTRIGATAGGLVSRLLWTEARPARAVIDLVDTALVDRAFLLPPSGGNPNYRLVIDLLPSDPQAFALAFASPLALPLPAEAEPPPPPARGDTRRLIVLDPGHGGHDPGATSFSGRYEKDITLAVAKTLAEQLRKTGRYRVLLTRERDVALKLGDRVRFAREREADLFLSIHADSLRNAPNGLNQGIRGASIYTRAEDATDRDAEALALRENNADRLDESTAGQQMDDVLAILVDLASRDTPILSRRFAGLLASSLSERVAMRRQPRQAANFKVLAAPDVPSALLELGYLSNAADEALLLSDQGQAQLAAGILAAIDRYFTAR